MTHDLQQVMQQIFRLQGIEEENPQFPFPMPTRPARPNPNPTLSFPDGPGKTLLPGEGEGGGGGGGGIPGDTDETLALLLPLLILLTTLLFLLLVFLLFLILLRKKRGIVLRDENGPLNLEEEDELEGEGGLEGVERRWLEGVSENVRAGYMRSKVWQSQYPPNSHPTDITLSQFLTIQEKGISAWSFEPDYESNPALLVHSRTEITFLADGIGMAEEEGGGCNVQSNLPLPRLNEVYYWECKMFEKPRDTEVSVGLATRPFPNFRLPGRSKYSVGYFSSDGFKSHSYPFTSQSYGPPLTEGDVLGVGYRPRTGTVFFTRNGKKLEDAYVGLNKHNLFPTVGANAACCLHVNLGQAGFVFIEANVKKWGLAPMAGTLAPPPAYGSERGSILLEATGNGNGGGSGSNLPPLSRRRIATATTTTVAPPPPSTSTSSSSRRAPTHKSRRREEPSTSPSTSLSTSHHISPQALTTAVSAANALSSSSSNSQPIRPSPLRQNHARNSSTLSSANNSASASASISITSSVGSEEAERNPPTPGLLDMSLHSLHRFPQVDVEESSGEEGEGGSGSSSSGSASGSGSEDGEEVVRGAEGVIAPVRVIEPPAYHPIDPHVYAPGVAEAILEDAFANVASRQFAPVIPSNFNTVLSNEGGADSGSGVAATNTGVVGGEEEVGWWSWLGGNRRNPTPSGGSNV